MDSHADSPVVRKNAYSISAQDKITVSSFTNTLVSKTVPVVDVAVVYYFEFTSRVYILIIRNALYFAEIIVNLIAPFIFSLVGLQVNEELTFMVTDPTLDHHYISVPNTNTRFMMVIKVIMSYLPTHLPPSDKTLYCHFVPYQCMKLTPELSYWNRYNLSYGIQEKYMLDYYGNLIAPRKISGLQTVMVKSQEDQDKVI